jgi:tripartite-type tricarboxylate transporter receptor subunit TctC
MISRASVPISFSVRDEPVNRPCIVARLIGEKLGVQLKQTVVPDSKPGANGVIAAELVARAAPDGYTLLVATGSSRGQYRGRQTARAWRQDRATCEPVAQRTHT